MKLIQEISKINKVIGNALGIELSDADFADGRDELLHIFLHEACHAAVARCVPWVYDLDEEEHTAVDELMARVLELAFSESLDLPVHSNAEFLTELSDYPVEIDPRDLDDLVLAWEGFFWPRRDLPGMATHILNVLRFREVVYHILPAADWEKAQADGVYSPVSMESDGFIHCSLIQQVRGTLQNFFAGQKDLLILCIAGPKVKPDIRYEDLYNAGQTFPHIYGLLNLDAVVGVLSLTRDQDGDFHFTSPNNID